MEAARRSSNDGSHHQQKNGKIKLSHPLARCRGAVVISNILGRSIPLRDTLQACEKFPATSLHKAYHGQP